METAKLVLEFTKVLLSAPVVAGVVAVVFFSSFREDIRALIRRIAKIRLPGGGELSTSQAERAAVAGPEDEVKPVAPPTELVTLPQDLTLTREQADRLRQVLQAERANAHLWEYRFLNYFLVPHTQRVLDWLALC